MPCHWYGKGGLEIGGQLDGVSDIVVHLPTACVIAERVGGAQPESQLAFVQPGTLAKSDAQEAQGMLGMLPGASGHRDVACSGDGDGCHAADGRVEVETAGCPTGSPYL